MKLPQRKTVIKYAIATTIGLLFSWTYLAIQKNEFGAFAERLPLDQLRLLCDAFTIPGLLLTLSGLMVMVTNEGSLDGLRYLGHYVVHMMLPGKRASIKRYADYVEENSAKRINGYGFLYIVGGAFLLLAALFYGLYKLQG